MESSVSECRKCKGTIALPFGDVIFFQVVTSSGLPHSDSTPQREEQTLPSEKQKDETKEQTKEQSKEQSKEDTESLPPKKAPTDKRLEDVEGTCEDEENVVDIAMI